jgi:predicted AAA+ superfamily ATPase
LDNLLQNAKQISSQKFRLNLPKYKRFLYQNILNSKDNIIGIYGSRGVGKTTLMLQVAKELGYAHDELLYISCDHVIFNDLSLFEFIEYFYNLGGKCILIDEIHEAKNFEQELKSVYDFFDIKVIFSGSSTIQLTNTSFARRYATFHLPILSLREFCEIKLDIKFDSVSWEQIISDHENISTTITEKLSSKKILKQFTQFIDYGAYPYFFVDENSYHQKVMDSINTILYTDIALIYKVPASSIEILKKLLHTICLSKPLELSMESLSRSAGIAKSTLYKYLDYLHRAELLRHITHEGKRFKAMQKPDKLYLSNTNLFGVLCNQADKGTLRETFFASQVSYKHSIYYIDRGDFLVDETYTIEIGGKNKKYSQVKDIQNSYLVCDDIEIGFGNKIPLWLFGFLY